jgi:antibiotic biosynthesis monooxygenase (ABM) superfamily enzyme
MEQQQSQQYSVVKPATAIASHRVDPNKAAEYSRAQDAITQAARKFPGFVGTEVLGPVPGLQEEWVAIFRLESNDAMRQWLDSNERKELSRLIDACLLEPARMLVLASDDLADPPVAEVFTHRVRNGKANAYIAWRRRAIAAQAHYPGYLATDSFEPHGKSQEEWIDIVRYDSVEHLEIWMKSKERQQLLSELTPLVESVHEHRLATGLEGWFNLNRRADEPINVPPVWKQTVSVVFALYPTVMVLALLINPLLKQLAFPVQMLIANILSCTLLSYLVMPFVTRSLKFWLSPPASGARARGVWMTEALGISTVIAITVSFVLIFYTVFKLV